MQNMQLYVIHKVICCGLTYYTISNFIIHITLISYNRYLIIAFVIEALILRKRLA